MFVNSGGETHNRTEQSTAQTQEMLEKENDELVHSLKSKVSTMKAVSERLYLVLSLCPLTFIRVFICIVSY